MSVERLAGLLARRLREEGVPPDGSVSVAELRRQLLPYPYCRERLELASKAEYDLAMLELLAAPELLTLDDSELGDAVEREADEPEPGLGFLEGYAAAQVRPGPALAERVAGGAEGDEDELRLDGGRPADIGPVGRDRPVRLVDEGEEEDEEESVGGGNCRACGGDLPPRDDLRFCPWCGADQEAPTCGGCGAELDETWTYCPECGEPADG